MSDEEMKPIELLISEEEFLAALAQFILKYAAIPQDGKWRMLRLEFEVRADDPPRSLILGGRQSAS